MGISRKEFLRLTGAAAVALPLAGLSCCKSKSEKTASVAGEKASPETQEKYGSHLGIQLYTVRDAFAADPEGTLKELAGIGYKELEFASPDILSKYVPLVNDLGMKVTSTHFLPGFVTGNWEAAGAFGVKKPENYSMENIIEDCVENEVPNLVIAILWPDERKTLDDFKSVAEKANKAGQKCRDAGLQLYYHNHSFEFKPTDGTTPFEAMMSVFDPELVKNELDVFWATVGSQDPVKLMTQYPDRIKMLHLKDLKAGIPGNYTTFDTPKEAFRSVGSGVIDFKKILETAHKTGVRHCFVEQDASTDKEIFQSVADSYNYIQKLGL